MATKNLPLPAGFCRISHHWGQAIATLAPPSPLQHSSGGQFGPSRCYPDEALELPHGQKPGVACRWPCRCGCLRFGIAHPGADTFPDQFPLKLRHRRQDMEHQPRGGIAFIGVDVLRDGKERTPCARNASIPSRQLRTDRPNRSSLYTSTASKPRLLASCMSRSSWGLLCGPSICGIITSVRRTSMSRPESGQRQTVVNV